MQHRARHLFDKCRNRVAFYARKYWDIYVVKNPQTISVDKWYRDGCDQRLRLDYPLVQKSVVFDLGGYKGEWAAAIYERYQCEIFVFEPVPQFFEQIRSRFSDISNIHTFNFGLADNTKAVNLVLCAEGSSIYKAGGHTVQIKLKDIMEFLSENAIRTIDLIKINIEGAEYDLLERMIAEGLTLQCADIQIQFHSFIHDATARRDRIRRALNQTHYLTYDYPFVWENWRKKGAS